MFTLQRVHSTYRSAVQPLPAGKNPASIKGIQLNGSGDVLVLETTAEDINTDPSGWANSDLHLSTNGGVSWEVILPTDQGPGSGSDPIDLQLVQYQLSKDNSLVTTLSVDSSSEIWIHSFPIQNHAQQQSFSVVNAGYVTITESIQWGLSGDGRSILLKTDSDPNDIRLIDTTSGDITSLKESFPELAELRLDFHSQSLTSNGDAFIIRGESDQATDLFHGTQNPDGNWDLQIIPNLRQSETDFIRWSAEFLPRISADGTAAFIISDSRSCLSAKAYLFDLTTATYSFIGPEYDCEVNVEQQTATDYDYNSILSSPDLKRFIFSRTSDTSIVFFSYTVTNLYYLDTSIDFEGRIGMPRSGTDPSVVSRSLRSAVFKNTDSAGNPLQPPYILMASGEQSEELTIRQPVGQPLVELRWMDDTSTDSKLLKKETFSVASPWQEFGGPYFSVGNVHSTFIPPTGSQFFKKRGY